MPNFQYKTKDANGVIRSGSLEAKSKSAARATLLKMRLKIVKLTEERDSAAIDMDETPILGHVVFRDANGKIQMDFGSQAPTAKELIIFTKQFATMLASGVPLLQSLEILSKQQASRGFTRTLKKIKYSVENGETLSNSMREHKDTFDDLYVAMVEAGEASGSLDVILQKLVIYIEKSAKIKDQVKSAMMYPVIVLVVAIAVVTGLLVFVVPVFAAQYSEGGRELPELTQMVIDFSDFFEANWIMMLIVSFALFVLFRLWLKTDSGRVIFDKNILKTPIIGDLLRKIAVGRFCSTMSSMLMSGVNLLEALNICAASSGNKTVEGFVDNIKLSLEKGSKFSEPLGEGTLFPDMVVSMVAVGEATGALDEMLAKVSDYYEEEVDLAVATMLSMIEPIMIVFIGGVIAFIVIAMYLPIFDMASGIE